MTVDDRRTYPRVPGFVGRILDDAGGPVGTCFQVTPSILVTAWHVLDGHGKAAAGTIVGVDPLSGGDAFNARVLATDSQHDLAVLRSTREFPATIAGFAATDTVPNETEVIVIAAGEVDDHDHVYGFMEATGAWRGATVRDNVVALGRFTSVDVLRGMSGAPVCQQSDGLVVGVLSGRYNSADGWLAHSVWVSRTEYLAELLNGVTTFALLDVSRPAVVWRERQAVFLEAMAHLARDQRDAFLIGNCGPPPVTAFVRKNDPDDRQERDHRQRDHAVTRTPVDQRIPASELLAVADNCWLLGGPGAGKSRLLRSWTVELVGRVTATAVVHQLPVLLRASDLAALIGSPVGPIRPIDSLAAAVNAGLDSVGHEGLPWLAEWLTNRPVADVEWVILVDGLDEISHHLYRRRVFKVLTAVGAEAACRCRVVVASRPLTVDDIAGVGWLHDQYELLAFDNAQRDEFVRGWFAELGLDEPERAARDFVADLHRRGLHELARIPLMLVILSQLFAYHPGSTLPASRVDAYERIVEEMHRRRPSGAEATIEIHDWLDPDLPAAVERLHERLGGSDGLLSRLAFERFRGRAESAVDWICEQTDELWRMTTLPAGQWRVVVREALRSSRLLVAHGRDFEFVHATLHEFFAARHLARDRHLSRLLLRLIFGRRGERFPVVPRWQFRDLTREVAYGHYFPFTDWVFAFWSDWPRFTTTMLRSMKRDCQGTCVFVAFLAWRWVRLPPQVLSATQAHLIPMLARSRGDDQHAVSVPDLLAMVGDPAGFTALADAAKNSQLGFGRITAAKKLIALGDPRGLDLLAEATEAVVTAPEPSQFSDNEAEARRRAAGDLARRGHPNASDLLKRFLLDPRTDDGRTRRYTYAMLDYYADQHTADVLTRLLVEVPATDRVELHYRSKTVDGLLRMTDPGCADRLTQIAAASATIPSTDRGRAAVRLADLGDPRAADLLAVLTDDGDTDGRLQIAWTLARLGDLRAISPLVALADHAYPWRWQSQVKAAATNSNLSAADVLAAIAAAPALPAGRRCDILQWLTLINDPRGIERAVRAASDPDMAGGLLVLADALARRHDQRFTTLLAQWADQLDDTPRARFDDERRWAARVLSAPEQVLGDGLLSDQATAQEINPLGRFLSVLELFHTDHPRAMDCLLAMHRDFEKRADTLNDKHLSPRYHAINLLAEKGSLVALPRLAERIRDSDRYESERSEALKALTELDGPAVADMLVKLAPHIAHQDRWCLINKLLDTDDTRAGAVLTEWLIADLQIYPYDGWDWKLDKLLRLGDPHAIDVLEHLVEQQFSGNAKLSLDAAINDVASVGGPRAADVLARWAADPRFTMKQRIKAAHALTTVDIDRATEVTQDLMADRSLTHQERDLATKALIPDPPPRSQMEALYLHNAHTPSDLRRVRAILG